MSDSPAPTDRTPAQVVPAEIPGLNGLLTLAGGVVVVAGLYFGRDILIPITLAVIFSLLITPLVNLLRRIKLGRVPSVLLAVVVALGVIIGVGGLLGEQFAELAATAPQYETTVMNKVSAIRGFVTGKITGIVDRLGGQLQSPPNAPAKPGAPPANPPPAKPSPAAAAPGIAKPLPLPLQQADLAPIAIARSILGGVLSPLTTIVIVLIFSVFILLQREDLRDRLIRLFGSGDLHRTTLAMNDAVGRLSKYFLVQLGINITFGVIIGVGLFAIGVPSPLLWGTVSMLLRFLPYIGSPLSSIGPLLLAAAVSPHWSMLISTAALYALVETITGQVVEPLLYGRSTGLSPFAVVVAATFWTWLWGPIGLLLSTPLTLCLVVLGKYVKRFEFLDVLLGDQPALSSVESFYQRILAGDPDEALDQAEVLLKSCSLSEYYDEVVLRGLQMAANDALRGVLSGLQLDKVKNTIANLVNDLDGHDDNDPTVAAEDLPVPEYLPSVWRAEGAVLCIAGRGPLDEGAATMLAQLLTKHRLGARAVPFTAVSRDNIGTLDVTGVAMICVSYLEISGSPAHLRYLLHRLHRKIPRAPILVGLWPTEDETLRDERVRGVIGAEYYVSTLREAVEACERAASEARASTPPVVVPEIDLAAAATA